MSIQGETNLIEVEVDLHAYLKAAISWIEEQTFGTQATSLQAKHPIIRWHLILCRAKEFE